MIEQSPDSGAILRVLPAVCGLPKLVRLLRAMTVPSACYKTDGQAALVRTEVSCEDVTDLLEYSNRGNWCIALGERLPESLPRIYDAHGLRSVRAVQLFETVVKSDLLVITEWGGYHDFGYAVISTCKHYRDFAAKVPDLFTSEVHVATTLRESSTAAAFPFGIGPDSNEWYDVIQAYFHDGITVLCASDPLADQHGILDTEDDVFLCSDGYYRAFFVVERFEHFVRLVETGSLLPPLFLFPLLDDRGQMLRQLAIETLWLEDAFGILSMKRPTPFLIADGICEDCGLVVYDVDNPRLNSVIDSQSADTRERIWPL